MEKTIRKTYIREIIENNLEIVVLIPVYKDVNALKHFEECALLRFNNQFYGRYDIVFIGPEKLKSQYILKYPGIGFYTFNKKYFKSIKCYNKMMKSIIFYETFNKYKFLLVAQTDAWIFGTSNHLEYFSKYDYSGAISFFNDKPIGFNGGLSLRNVQASIKALKSWRNYETPLEIWKRHFPVGRFAKPYKLVSVILDLLIRKKVHHRFNFINKGNEDIFWSVLVPKAVPEFKVITPEDAVKFSWENNCEELSKTNELPFGCHGWWNYNYDFWKDIIKINERQGTN